MNTISATMILLMRFSSSQQFIPSLQFSSDETRLSWLNRSVALYWLAFGQPRQDDLLDLLDYGRDEISPQALAQLQISLRPE